MLTQENCATHSGIVKDEFFAVRCQIKRLTKVFSTVYPQLIQQLLTEERLPESYAEDAKLWLLPFIEEVRAKVGQQNGSPWLLGINGAQGTGKTTLCKLIKSCLESEGLAVLVLSIDDFYLSKAARKELAGEVHPLLATRGVPGTHDTAQLISLISALQNQTLNQPLLLPLFDKASDDVVPQNQCPRVEHPVDLIILEGWFVGVLPECDAAMAAPINHLESEEDQEGIWRHYVNHCLARDYVPIFERLDELLLLKAPSFELVYEWRGLQEQKLRDSSASGSAGVMTEHQLQRFIQHYERLTRHGLSTLPAYADVVFTLDEEHRITGRSG